MSCTQSLVDEETYIDVDESCGHVITVSDEGSKEQKASMSHTRKTRTPEEAKKELDKRKWLRSETMKIIESLLDGRKDEFSLRRSLSLLSKQEYDDVTVERSIGKICGHPLCDFEVTEDFNLKQKFKIDVRNKAILNMEERSRFCSLNCLKASLFLKEQLADESLWMRYNDHLGFDDLYAKGEHISFYPTIKGDQDKKRDVLGKDVMSDNISSASKKIERKEISSKESVSFPYIKPEHLEQLKLSSNKLVIKERETPIVQVNKTHSAFYSHVETNVAKNAVTASSLVVREGDIITSSDKYLDSHLLDRKTVKEEVQKQREESGIHGNQSTSPLKLMTTSNSLTREKQLSEEPAKKTSRSSLSDLQANAVKDDCQESHTQEKVMLILTQWFTKESLQFLHGEYVDAAVTQETLFNIKSRLTDSRQESNNEVLHESIQKIIAKLDQEDLLEDVLDAEILCDQLSSAEKKNKELIAEIDSLPQEDGSSKKTTKDLKRKRRSVKKVTFKEETAKESSQEESRQFFNSIPFTSKNPVSLRRKTVLEQLHKCMRQHLPHDLINQTMTSLKEIIRTFDLTPKNVVLSAEGWTLMMLFLLRLLDFKDSMNMNDRKQECHNEMVVQDMSFQGNDTTDHDVTKIHAIMNHKSIRRLEESLFQSKEDWVAQLELFLCKNKG